MKALILVDIQNDFCPGGALPVPEGNLIVPVANRREEIDSAHFGHALVGDDHLRRAAVDQLEGLGRAIGGENLDGFISHQTLQRLEDVDLVIDE